MIIDCHAHVVAPDSLYAFRSLLLTSAGHFDPPFAVNDEALTKSAAGNVALMDQVQTDVQMPSPISKVSGTAGATQRPPMQSLSYTITAFSCT
jgi:hypothetical protein